MTAHTRLQRETAEFGAEEAYRRQRRRIAVAVSVAQSGGGTHRGGYLEDLEYSRRAGELLADTEERLAYRHETNGLR